MEGKYITPTPGTVYKNRHAASFYCETVTCDGAVMKSVASGWTMLVHGVQQYEDGTIEWDYSSGGYFDEKWREEHGRRIEHALA